MNLNDVLNAVAPDAIKKAMVPNALRLANALDGAPVSNVWTKEAAAELRRLHAINTELVEALERLIGEAEFPTQKINKLGAIIQAEMALKKAKQ